MKQAEAQMKIVFQSAVPHEGMPYIKRAADAMQRKDNHISQSDNRKLKAEKLLYFCSVGFSTRLCE